MIYYVNFISHLHSMFTGDIVRIYCYLGNLQNGEKKSLSIFLHPNLCVVLQFDRFFENLATLYTFDTSWGRIIGPDRLAGPNALDPYYCRQPTLPLHDLEVLIAHGTELRLFGAKAFYMLNTVNVAHLSCRYNFYRLYLWRSLGRASTHHLPNNEQMHHVLCHVLFKRFF